MIPETNNEQFPFASLADLPDEILKRLDQVLGEIAVALDEAEGDWDENEIADQVAKRFKLTNKDLKWERKQQYTKNYLEEHRLIGAFRAQEQLELGHAGWLVAYKNKIVQPVDVPWWMPEAPGWGYYPSDITLSEKDRAYIARNTLLLRRDVLKRLDISVKEFNRLKRKNNLKTVNRIYYRLSDIDQLSND